MALLTSMKNAAIADSSMGLFDAMVWEDIEGIIIEVWADALGCEYVAKADGEIFITEDINEFNEALVYAFS